MRIIRIAGRQGVPPLDKEVVLVRGDNDKIYRVTIFVDLASKMSTEQFKHAVFETVRTRMPHLEVVGAENA